MGSNARRAQAARWESSTDRSASIRATLQLFIGLGCLIALSRMVSAGFVGYLSDGAALSSDPFYFYRACAGALMFVAIAVAGHTQAYSPGVGALLACAVVATASVILFAVYSQGSAMFSLENEMMIGSFASVLGGAAVAMLSYLWTMLLSSYAVKRIALVSVGAFVTSEAVLLVASAADSSLTLVIAVVCAFVSGMAIFAIDPDLATCKADGRLGGGDGARLPWFGIAVVIALVVLSGIMLAILQWRYYDVPLVATAPITYVLAFASMLAIAAIMTKLRNWERFAWLPPVAIFAATLVALFFFRGSGEIAYALAVAAMLSASYALWAIYPASVSQSAVPHAALSALVLLFANSALSTSAGAIIAQQLPQGVQSFTAAAGVAAVGLIVVLAACTPFLQGSNVKEEALPAQVAARVPEATHAAATHAAPAATDVPPATEIPSAANILSAAEAPDRDADIEAQPTETAAALSIDESMAAHDVSSQGVAASSAVAPEDTPAPTAVEAAAPATAPAAEPEMHLSPLEQMKLRVDAIGDKYQLTARETEVALLTAQGFSCAYIADKLIVSNSTVRYHQQNAYRKLNVHSRNDLIEFVNRFDESNNA